MEQEFKVGDYVRLKKEFYKEDEFKSMSRPLRQCVASLKNGKSNVLGVMDSQRDYGSIVVAHGEEVYILPPCIFELAEPEKNPVVEVNRQANVGEWIKIIRPWCSFGNYTLGDIFLVDKVEKNGGVYSGSHIYLSYGAGEYVVLENYEPPNKHNDALDAVAHSCEALSKSLSKHVNLVTKTRRWTPEEIVKAQCFLGGELIYAKCKFVYNKKNGRTACFNYENGRSAEAKCAPNDMFNPYIGAVVAYCKTCGVKIPEFITR